MTEQYRQEELWRTQIAERVAAHKARRPAQPPVAREPVRPQARVARPPLLPPVEDTPATHSSQLTQRAVENVRRRLEERAAREEADRREREELELFFAEFDRTQAPDEAPPAPVHSNLIAFPRIAIATAAATAPARELPPLEEALPSQLTIFEAMQPQFTPALRLDEHLDFDYEEPEVHHPEALFELPLKVAPVGLRAWAGFIDAALVTGCALGFGSIFYGIHHELPKGKPALVAALVILWAIWTIYQVLFLAYSGSTPGLKVMRLGISTYEDEVPDTRTRIKRAVALLMTSMSLGLGFIWTLLDEDRLAWHDRMTRTYPRQLA